MPRSTLYRWRDEPTPKSRRPHHVRKPAWSSALPRAVEELRLDNPMWGKRKLAWLLRREGWAVSVFQRRPHPQEPHAARRGPAGPDPPP